MNMNQRARQIMKQWAILGVALIVLHVLFFVGYLIINPTNRDSLTPVLILALMYIIAGGIIMWVFYKRVSEAAEPIEYREALEQGLPATAKVLSIERTRWRNKRTRNFRLQVRPQMFEYQMRVRISREGVPDYEVDLAEFLVGDDVPEKGDIIAVKVHPQQPNVIVMLLDEPSKAKRS